MTVSSRQMPALIVSTAAGLMVSKAGVEGSTDKAMMNQLSFYPQALGMVSTVMGVVSVLPGMPHFVFAGLAVGIGALAWFAYKKKEDVILVYHTKLQAIDEIFYVSGLQYMTCSI